MALRHLKHDIAQKASLKLQKEFERAARVQWDLEALHRQESAERGVIRHREGEAFCGDDFVVRGWYAWMVSSLGDAARELGVGVYDGTSSRNGHPSIRDDGREGAIAHRLHASRRLAVRSRGTVCPGYRRNWD